MKAWCWTKALVEIVRPGTGDPVPEGEVGELVTTLNTDYPLIRFGTGDLSAVLPGDCPTGRTNTRIKGWMGRADQTHQGARHVRPPGPGGGHRQALSAGATRAPGGHGRNGQRPDGAAGGNHRNRRQTGLQLQDAVREVTKLRGEMQMVAPGSLPNDGKVIEDARSYK